jgi:hypothetical protein
LITTDGAEARGVGALGVEKTGLALRSSARLRVARSIRCERSARISCWREFSRDRLKSDAFGLEELPEFCVLSVTARLRVTGGVCVGATAVELGAGRGVGLLQTE